MVKGLNAEIGEKKKIQIVLLFGLKAFSNSEVYRTTGESFIEKIF